MTDTGDREILDSMLLAVLALGGLWITFIALSAVALLVLAVYAFWRMRSEDFWEEQD